MSKLAISSKVMRFTPNFWMKLGGLVPKWVKDDALKGLMQNGTQNLHYKSREYIKYKANQMRRFTKGGALSSSIKGKKDIFFNNPKAGINKKGIGTGDRLKEYKGIPIQSTDVSKVNMTLTGRTIDSLHPKTSDDTGVLMAFNPAYGGIVIGNRQRGYDITGLNEQNKKKVHDLIVAQLDENLRKEIKGKIVIEIGK